MKFKKIPNQPKGREAYKVGEDTSMVLVRVPERPDRVKRNRATWCLCPEYLLETDTDILMDVSGNLQDAKRIVTEMFRGVLS